MSSDELWVKPILLVAHSSTCSFLSTIFPQPIPHVNPFLPISTACPVLNLFAPYSKPSPRFSVNSDLFIAVHSSSHPATHDRHVLSYAHIYMVKCPSATDKQDQGEMVHRTWMLDVLIGRWMHGRTDGQMYVCMYGWM